MSSSPQILVFDSGVGALSIIAEIRRALPGVSITYASDNGFFPYGTKSEDELIARVDRVLGALVAESRPDIIVVACNTASTVTLPHIRSHFSIPIVGVVPAIKPAARVSASRVIGLLATPGTVSRPYTRQLIEEFAADCDIVSVGSSELVLLAESKLRGEAPDMAAIRQTLEPLTGSPQFEAMDTVILACTHFPLLREELAENLGKPVRWMDSGDAIARRVAQLLEEWPGAGEKMSAAPEHRSLFTLGTSEVEQLRPGLANYLPGPVGFFDVES